LAISADEPSSQPAAGEQPDPASKPVLHVRAYMVQTKRSGQKLPRVDLDEIGPRSMFSSNPLVAKPPPLLHSFVTGHC